MAGRTGIEDNAVISLVELVEFSHLIILAVFPRFFAVGSVNLLSCRILRNAEHIIRIIHVITSFHGKSLCIGSF